jgi:hypothetical protein
VVEYDGSEYLLRGARQREGEQRPRAPSLSTPCAGQNYVDEALSRLYRFASVLGYFKRGYVDITASAIWSYMPVGFVSNEAIMTVVTQAGRKAFSCNRLPVIEDDQVRKALAFLREGRRLRHVHEPYSFLSYFKVIESQFGSRDRVTWIDQNISHLEGAAAKR